MIWKKEMKIGSFFRGNAEYGEELIKAFEDAGGENIVEYNGRDEPQIYYLTKSRAPIPKLFNTSS